MFPCRLIAILLAALLIGCEQHSRYGITYDRRMPGIKRVAVLPAVEVLSIHTGGAEEPRPDLEPELIDRTLEAIQEVLAERGCELAALQNAPPTDENPGDDLAKHCALLNAVFDAIVTHHYQPGKARLLDYSTGQSAGIITNNERADALLCVYLTGVVPTAGRDLLAGTTLAVRVLTGPKAHVSTNEAFMMLMLIDRKSGDVLWFDRRSAETDVRDKQQLRRFIRQACESLLKPRKSGVRQ